MTDNPHDNVVNNGLDRVRTVLDDVKQDRALSIFIAYGEMDRGELLDLRDDIIQALKIGFGIDLVMTSDGTTVLMKVPE